MLLLLPLSVSNTITAGPAIRDPAGGAGWKLLPSCSSPTPATHESLRVAAEAFPLPWVATVVSVGGVTAMLGVILSQLLGLSRMAFAMARRRDLPALLDQVHPKHGVPARAVLITGAVAASVAATGTLRGVASAASFTILVYYGIANVASLKMRSEAKLFHDVVPIMGVGTCALLAMSLSSGVILAGLGVLVAGVIVRTAARSLSSR